MKQTKLDQIKRMYRDDVKNITMPPEKTLKRTLPQIQASKNLAPLLSKLKTVIAVTLEYEHLLALVSVSGQKLNIQYLEIPHPSGVFFKDNNLIVSSTRSPNQILFFKLLDKKFRSETTPSTLVNLRAGQTNEQASHTASPLLIPIKTIFLPGHFSVHDVVDIKNNLYVTVTGLNFVAKIHPDGGFERAWNPKCVDRLGKKAFTTNYLQLNSIARGKTLGESFFTAFSDKPTQEKPWKEGYGPKGKGVVFEGSSRETIYRGLTCPHSVRKFKQQLWLCDSGMGELGILEPKGSSYTTVVKAPGFTRGLTFLDSYAIVGLSKVIPQYEPYAPGLDARKSQCGIVFVNLKSGRIEATLTWPDGFQVYDIQTLDGVPSATLPVASGSDAMNYYLTYYGWDRNGTKNE